MGSLENENFSYHLGCCQRLLRGQKSPTPLNPRRQPDGFLRIFPWISEALRRGNHIRRSAFVTVWTDGKIDYRNRPQRCQPENCFVPAGNSQPSVKMIVRRMSCTPRRTIRQSQGGFQEPRFLNRFLSKFLCRHKEILCIPNPRAGGMRWIHQKMKISRTG